jgi:hypothetical protein
MNDAKPLICHCLLFGIAVSAAAFSQAPVICFNNRDMCAPEPVQMADVPSGGNNEPQPPPARAIITVAVSTSTTHVPLYALPKIKG